MTDTTGQRRNSARLKQLSQYLRTVHQERHGLSLRRKTRPNGQGLVYLSFWTRPDGGGDQKWLKLTASYEDTDLAISRAIDQALADFDSNIRRNAGGPVGSSLGIHQRKAFGIG